MRTEQELKALLSEKKYHDLQDMIRRFLLKQVPHYIVKREGRNYPNVKAAELESCIQDMIRNTYLTRQDQDHTKGDQMPAHEDSVMLDKPETQTKDLVEQPKAMSKKPDQAETPREIASSRNAAIPEQNAVPKPAQPVTREAVKYPPISTRSPRLLVHAKHERGVGPEPTLRTDFFLELKWFLRDGSLERWTEQDIEYHLLSDFLTKNADFCRYRDVITYNTGGRDNEADGPILSAPMIYLEDAFALEQLLEELAKSAGSDRLDIRLRLI